MKITLKQILILKSIRCKKISKKDKNWLAQIQPILVDDKENKIAIFFKNIIQATTEDEYASYALITRRNKVLLYFTIRCGEMQKIDVQKPSDEALDIITRCIPFYKNLIDKDNEVENKRKLYELFGEATAKGIDTKWLESQILRAVDREREPVQSIKRVDKTYPGVELVAYGKTKEASLFKERHKLPKAIGQTLFWFFIVPKFIDIRKIVGCQYVYLFAAAEKPESKLVSIYKDSLHFNADDGIGVNKPDMDMNCWLRYQKINELTKWRSYFFKNFNPDEDDV